MGEFWETPYDDPRRQKIVLKEMIEGFLDIVVHKILNYPAGIPHAAVKEDVIDLNPVFFAGLDERGFLEEFYQAKYSPYFLSGTEDLGESVGLEKEVRDIEDIEKIWTTVVARNPNYPGLELARDGSLIFVSSRLPHYWISDAEKRRLSKKNDTGAVIPRGKIAEVRDELMIDILLDSWNAGVPVEHVLA